MKKILRNDVFEKDLAKQLEKIINGFKQKFKEIEESNSTMKDFTDIADVSDGIFHLTVTVGTLISFFTLQEKEKNVFEIIDYEFPRS